MLIMEKYLPVYRPSYNLFYSNVPGSLPEIIMNNPDHKDLFSKNQGWYVIGLISTVIVIFIQHVHKIFNFIFSVQYFKVVHEGVTKKLKFCDSGQMMSEVIMKFLVESKYEKWCKFIRNVVQ